jgi:branched-chain amino acid transport system substrate-binding protein
MRLITVVVALAALLCFRAVAAELVVAQVGPLTGPLGANGTANFVGAKAHFDQVNALGGLNGQKIRFVVEDDHYKPDETVKLLQSVAQREQPLVFLNLLGSANVTAVLNDKVLDRVRVPVVGITPGAESLREPGSPWLFHVHAGDRAQLQKIVAHLATVGFARIAVVYQDIPFGKSGLGFVEEAAPKSKMEVVARVAVPPAAEDLKEAVAKLKGSNAQAYLMVLAPNSGASFVRDVRGAGDRTPIYGMSYVPVKGLLEKSPANEVAGLALAQITPNPSSRNTGLTRDFHAAMDKYAPAGTDHSQLHLVGYLSARVATEALRRAGTSPTPDRVAATLRQLRFDAGNFAIDFSSGHNVGSQYVDIGVIDRDGRLRY